ncbi:MAG: membrane protein insertase YidC [Planctomycetota bacterium]
MLKNLKAQDFVIVALALGFLAYWMTVQIPKEQAAREKTRKEHQEKLEKERIEQDALKPINGDQQPTLGKTVVPTAPIDPVLAPLSKTPPFLGDPVTQPSEARLPALPAPKIIKLESDELELVFTEDCGALSSATLKSYTVEPADESTDASKAERVKMLDSAAPFLPSLRVVNVKLVLDDNREIEVLREDDLYQDLRPYVARRRFVYDPSRSTAGEWDTTGTVKRQTVCFYQELLDPSSGSPLGLRLYKEFTVYPNATKSETDDDDNPALLASRHIDVDIRFEASPEHLRAAQRFVIHYFLIGSGGVFPDGTATEPVFKYAEHFYQMTSIGGYDNKTFKNEFIPSSKLEKDESVVRELSFKPATCWTATQSRFFTAALIAYEPSDIWLARAYYHRTGRAADNQDKRYSRPGVVVTSMKPASMTLDFSDPLTSTGGDRFALFLGPLDSEILKNYDQRLTPGGYKNEPVPALAPLHLDKLIKFGGFSWFDPISRLLLAIFQGLHVVIRSYGLAVILLTIIVKLALYPIQKKSVISMSRMQKIQPMVKALNYKYKGQNGPEALRKKQMETMDLYKKFKVNPMSGCLPMFVQIPVFFALYGMFSTAYPMRHASFLWINDLSLPDRLAFLPFWPGWFNLLPIIYSGVMIYNALKTPKSDDPNQQMTRTMGFMMPVVFTFIFYNMPAGLVLYFTVSALFGLLESTYVRKRYISDEPLEPPKDLKRFIEKMDKEKAAQSGVVASGPTLDISDALK